MGGVYYPYSKPTHLPTYSYLRRYSMKAQEARAMYNKPYTLDEILNHIKSRAHESLSVHGYKSTRLNHEVRDTLERLGYTVGFSHMATDICISWEED